MAGENTPINQYDTDYKEEATRWIVEVLIIATVGSVINWVLIFSGPSPNPLLAFVVNIGLVVAGSFLLFRHVDTLIFKRLSQFQGGPAPHQVSSDSGGDGSATSVDTTETEGEASTVVQERQETDLFTRVKESLIVRLAAGFIAPLVLVFLLLALMSGGSSGTTTAPAWLSILLLGGPIVGVALAYITRPQ